MKVAYIISMVKRGVPAFTHREIDILCGHGFQIALFPLSYRPGPHMPKPEWPVYRIRARDVFAAIAVAKLTRPAKYFKLLAVALKNHSLREFVVGMAFARQMRRWGAEHIHCHFGDSKLYTGYYCSVWLDLPMTLTVHAYEIHRNPNPAMFKLAAERCSKIVVQSEFNREVLKRNLGVDEDKIVLIRAHGDVSDPAREGAIKILTVGEFREKKGHEVLFTAIKKLGRQDIVVWIVGEGPLDVPAMARDAGVADQVVCLGMVGKDLLNILYDSCDLFVLPSRTARDGDCEGIPAVLMEAMSHAKPVISTRHAGIPELVEDVLVDENDADALAAAIEQLSDDPTLRDRLGARNKEIVNQDFSTAAVLELGELFRASSRTGREEPDA
jgi:colanic acid/amylovoran biosynthesis glycosyltransferase